MDIRNFRKEGKVILMGDFNCRIGAKESVIISDTKQIVFPRITQDAGKSGDSSRGGYLVSSMNASQMVVMNGVDSGGECTFMSSNKGSSVIDFIILSDNIISPGKGSDIATVEDRECDLIQNCHDIPSDSLYVKKSMKVLTDYKYKVGDHFLVICKIKSSYKPTPVENQYQAKKLDILKWERRDNGNPEFWKTMQVSLEKHLTEWDRYFSEMRAYRFEGSKIVNKGLYK